MKFKYIIASLAAAVALFASCNPELEPVAKMKGLEVSNDYITIPTEGTAVTVTIKGDEDWTASIPDTKVDWLTIAPAAGAAGEEVTVSFSATESTAARKTEVNIVMGKKTKIINVNQAAPAGVEVPPSTVKEVLEGPDKTYKVTGKVTKITGTNYGNWYINDGTSETDLYIYGTCDKKGATFDKTKPEMEVLNCPANPNAWDLAVGDVVTIEGPKTVYNGTVELVDVTIVSIIPSLITVDNLEFSLPKEETTVTAKVQYSGDNLDFSSNAGWLSVSSISRVADTTFVNIHASANTEDTRKGVITLKSTKGEAVTEVNIDVTQASGLSAYPLPYNDPLTDGFGAWEVEVVTPFEGVENIWTNSSSYGMVGKVTGKGVSEASVISPNIDLTGAKNPVLTFQHAQRFAGNVDNEYTVYVTTDNGASWTQVLVPVYSDGKNWSYVASGQISLARFTGGLVKIKFTYKSTADAYGTWEFKDVKVEDVADASYKNIAELDNAAAATEASFKAELTDAVVSYVNGNNAFIQDATGGVQLYKSNHGLKEGDVISGTVTGKIKLYNGFAELTDINVSAATVTAGEAPAATVLTIDKLLASYLRQQNRKVKLEGITIDPALTTSNRNTTVKQGESSIAGYSQVKNKIEIAANTKGDLVCWPTRYNANLQVGIWDAAHFTAN